MKANNMLVLVTLLGLVSCGGGGGGGSGSSGNGNGSVVVQTPSSQEMSEATPGTYYTVLRPVNFHSNGFIPYGMATFTLKGDQLQVDVSMDDDQRVPHRQSLHIGARCPGASDDTNGDGLIDYNEAIAVVGSVIMPLDGDLNSQMGGSGVYPSGPAMTYSKIASLSKINSDLWKADEDPSDHVIKLNPGKSVGFEGRVVLAHGTTQNSFPTSLSSFRGEPAHLSLPVVCGVLKKIE